MALATLVFAGVVIWLLMLLIPISIILIVRGRIIDGRWVWQKKADTTSHAQRIGRTEL